uniref:Uncharacterized protein n=1 Tax=Sus scrofa TaxID=9823 RepID=A0A4X1U9I4_PIG
MCGRSQCLSWPVWPSASVEALSSWPGCWIFLATDPAPTPPQEPGPNPTCSRPGGVGALPASWPGRGGWAGWAQHQLSCLDLGRAEKTHFSSSFLLVLCKSFVLA